MTRRFYTKKGIKMIFEKHRRITKTILSSDRNKEEVGTKYRERLTALINKLKPGDENTAQTYTRRYSTTSKNLG